MTSRDTFLILRLSALGDILHTIPAVIALREARPEARFIWVVEPPYAEMTRALAPVDDVVALATKKWRRSLGRRGTWSDIRESVGELRRRVSHGTSIDFQGLVKSAVIGAAAACRNRYGFAPDAVRERASLLFVNRAVRVDTSQHVVEQNLALARGVGAVASLPPEVDVSRFAASSSEPALLDRVVLNPGAGRPEKLWGVERFAALAQEIAQRWSLRPLVVWGPGEEEMAKAIAEASPAELAPRTNLRELALLLQRARVVIAADTGPLHLAAAAGTPVIGLFGPTSPHRNGPYGQLHRVVESFSTSKKMEGIAVDDVTGKLGEILG